MTPQELAKKIVKHLNLAPSDRDYIEAELIAVQQDGTFSLRWYSEGYRQGFSCGLKIGSGFKNVSA